ncbi:MAG: alkaline phosphatase family protein [Gemmatimonadota bacterium]
MSRVLFVFVDGVGLGDDDATINPFVTARLPVLETLLEGARPLRSAAAAASNDYGSGSFHQAPARLLALDASLGMPGTPQSGTGQSSLLTGENTARRFGRHFGPWVPTALRPLVREHSVLHRAADAGLRVAFANAYPRALLERAQAEKNGRHLGPLRAGPPLAALGADLLTRHAADLLRGRAVASEIVNDGWRERLGHTELPIVSPAEAGKNLAAIAARHDLTLFAHYTTDYVGHRGSFQEAEAVLERFDSFLGGVLEDLPDDVLLLAASDHGNIEDVRVEHTHNPAFGLVCGDDQHPAEKVGPDLHSLLDVAGVIMRVLGTEG